MRSQGLCTWVALLVLVGGSSGPVGAARRSDTVISPEVHADRRVTFRLQAPGARSVDLEASFLPRGRRMARKADGMWTTTAGPLEPDIYEYSFVVDGLRIPDPVNPDVKVWRRRSWSVVLVPGQTPAFFEEQDVPHGTVRIHRYPSKSLGVTRGVYVYTPPDYEVRPEAKYPVLYLLHGSGDTELTWTVVGRANVILDNAIAQQRAEPMVVAMPYGHTPNVSADGRPGHRHAAFETDLIQDVLPYVEGRYRVKADRPHRAIAGLSMGGGQALRIGLGHPDLFAWVGAFSSSVPAEDELDTLLGAPDALNKHLDLLWVGCGRDDFLFERNQRFLEELKARGVEHTARITAGGHEWRLWRRYLNELLPLLFGADE